MDFSLVFPTRGRVALLDSLFRSLAATTADPGRVEVVPCVDDDDAETAAAIPDLTALLPGFSVSFRTRPRSRRLNEDYINWGARASAGRYVLVLNDDVLFQTSGWDRLAVTKLDAYLSDKPDGIVYGMTDDGMDDLRVQQKLEYTGFPVVSRRAIDVLGYAMHPSFSSWGADVDLFPIYQAAGRVCNLKAEVRVFHNSPHTQSRDHDEINHHVASLDVGRPSRPAVRDDINKLMIAITGRPLPEPQKTPKPAKPLPLRPAPSVPPRTTPAIDRYAQRMAAIKRKR